MVWLIIGLLHKLDAAPLTGNMQDYLQHPLLDNDKLSWHPSPSRKIRPLVSDSEAVFNQTGGLKVLATWVAVSLKSSAVAEQYHYIEADAGLRLSA